MEVENQNPNPGNDPNMPLKKKRSPNRLLVDDVKGSFAIETKIPLSKRIIRDFVSYDYQNYDLKILDF